MITTIALISFTSLIWRIKSGHFMMAVDNSPISITGMISGYTVRFSETNFSNNLESSFSGENPKPDPPGAEKREDLSLKRQGAGTNLIIYRCGLCGFARKFKTDAAVDDRHR